MDVVVHERVCEWTSENENKIFLLKLVVTLKMPIRSQLAYDCSSRRVLRILWTIILLDTKKKKCENTVYYQHG